MAALPTTGLTLSAVKQHFIDAGAGTFNTLAAFFANAEEDGFNPTYEGDKDRLSNFRGYNHVVATPAHFDITNVKVFGPFNGYPGTANASVSITNTGGTTGTFVIYGTWKWGSTVKGTESETVELAPGASTSVNENLSISLEGSWTYYAYCSSDSYLRAFTVTIDNN